MLYPTINPIALELGPLKIHWYGLMYLLGFIGAWLLATYRGPKQQPPWSRDQIGDMIFYSALGVIVGGRIGYMLIYNFNEFSQDPLSLFSVWQGGMSFHGGFMGVCIGFCFLARKYHLSIWQVSDFVAPLVPIGLAAGRIGNFINGELWGRVTTLPWAMVFPGAGPMLRHPSQLYESLLEGILLFIILWVYSAKPKPRGAVSGLFLLGYGSMRFIAEFFREPDLQIGFIAFDTFTMGQLLSLPMMILGGVVLYWAYRPKSARN